MCSSSGSNLLYAHAGADGLAMKGLCDAEQSAWACEDASREAVAVCCRREGARPSTRLDYTLPSLLTRPIKVKSSSGIFHLNVITSMKRRRIRELDRTAISPLQPICLFMSLCTNVLRGTTACDLYLRDFRKGRNSAVSLVSMAGCESSIT